MAPGRVWLVHGVGVVLLLLSAKSRAFQWTSDIQNGGKLLRCAGDNVTFPWSYVTESEENVIVQFWFANKSGSFASYFADKFMTSWDRVTQEGPAGLTLGDVSTADDDTYGVSVMLHDGREPLTQHITLTVAEPPTTTDAQLHVTSEHTQDATGARKTSLPDTRLKCGEFLSLGSPPVSVVWTDPSGRRLPTTTLHDGYFHLDLDPHARGGNYTCSVQREAVATQCLASDSPLLLAAVYRLVTTETVGAELLQLRRKLEELNQQVALSHATHTDTSSALWHTVTALQKGQANRTEALEEQVIELHNTDVEIRQASVNHNTTINLLAQQISELTNTNKELRQESAEQNGTISSIRSQVADLQKQNTDQATTIDRLEKQVSDQTTTISSLLTQNTDQTTTIDSLQKQVSDLQEISSELRQAVVDQNATISILVTQVADTNTELRQASADQRSTIYSLQHQVSAQNAEITALQANFSSEQETLATFKSDITKTNTSSSQSSKVYYNVAAYKPAAESSRHVSNLDADLAVDLNLNSNFFMNSCTHTEVGENNPWWRVDLEQVYDVTAVLITNRGDCCGNRLKDFYVDVLNDDPASNSDATGVTCFHYDGVVGNGATVTLQCYKPIPGRYVRVRKSSDILQLCEVQVIAPVGIWTP